MSEAARGRPQTRKHGHDARRNERSRVRTAAEWVSFGISAALNAPIPDPGFSLYRM